MIHLLRGAPSARHGRIAALLGGLVACCIVTPANAFQTTSPLTFRVTFDTALQKQAYNGRVYVILSQTPGREPRMAIQDWMNPPQILAKDITDASPTSVIILDHTSLAYPTTLAQVSPGEYQIQAVARRSLDHPVPGHGPGDLYSNVVAKTIDPSQAVTIELHLNQVTIAPPANETTRVKYVEIVSPSLSKFHGREVKIRAGVMLPVGWTDDPKAKYPVLYMLGGFGSDHRLAQMIAAGTPDDYVGSQVLTVTPDASCYRGHSVFADSKNNGPWGQALIEELIPHVEKKFHGTNSGKHRYVAGISSGGWASLWLQINYPDKFNGCWAHVPDPVDFRDFQGVNLYEPGANLFVEQDGSRHPLARNNDSVMLWYDDFVELEEILGPGGQISSFEAVFSHKLSNGEPAPLFDRKTGAVDSSVAKSWERYDIRLTIERNWSRLSSKLAGKLHIYAGEFDTFYLEGAVKLLKESLTKLGSDAEVEIIPDMAHSFHTPALHTMYHDILENFHAEFGVPLSAGTEGK